MWGFIIPLLVGLALNIVAYLIMPKPKKPKPPAAKDMESPTAEAGRPIPVLFGTVTQKGMNILWFGDKRTHEYQARVPTQPS
jgi:hypothetical protein